MSADSPGDGTQSPSFSSYRPGCHPSYRYICNGDSSSSIPPRMSPPYEHIVFPCPPGLPSEGCSWCSGPPSGRSCGWSASPCSGSLSGPWQYIQLAMWGLLSKILYHSPVDIDGHNEGRLLCHIPSPGPHQPMPSNLALPEGLQVDVLVLILHDTTRRHHRGGVNKEYHKHHNRGGSDLPLKTW